MLQGEPGLRPVPQMAKVLLEVGEVAEQSCQVAARSALVPARVTLVHHLFQGFCCNLDADSIWETGAEWVWPACLW